VKATESPSTFSPVSNPRRYVPEPLSKGRGEFNFRAVIEGGECGMPLNCWLLSSTVGKHPRIEPSDLSRPTNFIGIDGERHVEIATQSHRNEIVKSSTNFPSGQHADQKAA